MTSPGRDTAGAVRWTSNSAFTRAALEFADGSRLLFEHSSIRNRRAHASAAGTDAALLLDKIVQFRLNGRHLQLFFPDGTNLEFLPVTTDRMGYAVEEDDGTALGQA